MMKTIEKFAVYRSECSTLPRRYLSAEQPWSMDHWKAEGEKKLFDTWDDAFDHVCKAHPNFLGEGCMNDRNIFIEPVFIEYEERITPSQVEAWLGSDTLPSEIHEILAELANGEYDQKQLAEDIKAYGDE